MAVDMKKAPQIRETAQRLTMIQAINNAMKTMLEEDDTTIILGEDIGKNGGVWQVHGI